ncbi:DUF6074 family protein [Ahrensia marina]|uniref:Uncharacterized protein n=1 Tax=Ahrensia marina TaxID=1514904 RepID=A0A0N0VL74_9HYPH|nr:DUF6074 family protein [Ahrensia marina]KPA99980.1 hypothetical protein SU32_16290 [Ahrensia marina]
MSGNHLPLFNWQPPVKIIAFPASKQIGKARHVASLFMNKTTERAQQSYWEQIEKGFSQKLHKLGLSDAEITKELEAFAALVQKEVDILCHKEGVQK